ncbi:MAG TPA: hypothetical protein VGM01_08505 [Ktedonobacteraceae bacterium]
MSHRNLSGTFPTFGAIGTFPLVSGSAHEPGDTPFWEFRFLNGVPPGNHDIPGMLVRTGDEPPDSRL